MSKKQEWRKKCTDGPIPGGGGGGRGGGGEIK